MLSKCNLEVTPMARRLRFAGICAAVVMAVAMSATAAHATADGCAVVVRTYDGFLAVRAGPGARQFEIDRLRAGQIILTNHVSDSRYAGPWWRIGGVMDRIGGSVRQLDGWVHSAYLTPVVC
jgi:hypothetical protein